MEEAIQIYPEAGDCHARRPVSDAATFNLLLAHCTTVWLQADRRPIHEHCVPRVICPYLAASAEAMEDLKTILAGRSAFHSKAQLRINACDQPRPRRFPTARPFGAFAADARNFLHSCKKCLDVFLKLQYDACHRSAGFCISTVSPPMNAAVRSVRVEYQTHPSQYRHWKLFVSTARSPTGSPALTKTRHAPPASAGSTTTWVDIGERCRQPHPIGDPEVQTVVGDQRLKRCSAPVPTFHAGHASHWLEGETVGKCTNETFSGLEVQQHSSLKCAASQRCLLCRVRCWSWRWPAMKSSLAAAPDDEVPLGVRPAPAVTATEKRKVRHDPILVPRAGKKPKTGPGCG